MNPYPVMALALALMLSACNNEPDIKAERAKRAASSSTNADIVIGAVWPWAGAKGSLWQGIELATEEINANGGVLSRKLRIVKEDDESSLTKGRLIAEKFAENTDMVAVIGHLDSYIALPASAIYHSAGLVYLNPGSIDYQLSSQGYNQTFRSIPSNRSIGKAMAEYMAAQGYKRIAVYYVKEKAHQDFANYFEQRAMELGLTIVDRRSYQRGNRDFSKVIHNWQDLYQFDALFLGAKMPEGAHIIDQIHKIGLKVPIIAGLGIDTPQLMAIAGTAAEGVLVPEILSADKKSPEKQHFDDMYFKKYHEAPSSSAALGYDSVYLLTQAMRQANSSSSDKIAVALHNTQKWLGATGEFSFDDKGDIPDKKIGFKVVRGDQFEVVQ